MHIEHLINVANINDATNAKEHEIYQQCQCHLSK